MKKTKIGSVGVDSGQLMISDPCYVKDFIDNEFDIKSRIRLFLFLSWGMYSNLYE